eukprot:9479183-Pyramimonas_sp.AAC.1
MPVRPAADLGRYRHMHQPRQRSNTPTSMQRTDQATTIARCGSGPPSGVAGWALTPFTRTMNVA